MADADDSKEELASDRTDFAEDRTVLAHERSFAGWLRTGMAAVGIGLAFHALFKALEPDWVAKVIATVFLVIAILVFWSAERRASQSLQRLDAHKVEALRPMRLKRLSWTLIAATAALVAAMWLLV